VRKNGWSEEEEQYVRDNHEIMTDKQMAENLPRRTKDAVANRRVRLGFRKYKRPCKPKPDDLPDRSKSRFPPCGRPPWDGFVRPNRRREP